MTTPEEETTIPNRLLLLWYSYLDATVSLTRDEPEDVQLLKEDCPTLTRSLESRRRFLCRIILNLPEPFLLPPDLLALCLKVTKSACHQTIQYWLKLGLLELAGHEGQSRLFRRRLLVLDRPI